MVGASVMKELVVTLDMAFATNEASNANFK